MSKKVFSLFSGAGGLDLGLEYSDNYEVVFGNDVEGSAVDTFSNHFGNEKVEEELPKQEFPVVLKKDVEDIDFSLYNGFNPDILCGGPPCQDFSIMRGPEDERKGIKVKRGKLYSHFIRALVHLQPKAFIFENVPGLKNANNGKAYETILKDFSSLKVRWNEIKKISGDGDEIDPTNYNIVFNNVVDSSEIGVPQKRKRLIIVGIREDLHRKVFWKSDAEKELRENLIPKDSFLKKYPLTPIEAFKGEILSNLSDEYKKIMRDYEELVGKFENQEMKKWEKHYSKLSFNPIDDYLKINDIKPKDEDEMEKAFEIHKETLKELDFYGKDVECLEISDGSNKRANEKKKTKNRMKHIPPNENHEFVKGTKWSVSGRGFSLVYRRLHPLKPAYTVVAKGGGGTWGYHYRRDRSRLTNRERARLQSFPDDFEFLGRRGEVRSQIGEAVPPLLAKKIGEVLAKYI